MCRRFVRRIIQDKGRFVNVSSGIQVIPSRTMSVYGATKAGVAYFSEALDHDLRAYGAASYCILPGNYISSTNIGFTRLAGYQKSISRLSEEDKQFYGHSINKNLRIHESIVRDRIKAMGYNVKELELLYNVDLDHINQIRIPETTNNKHISTQSTRGKRNKLQKFCYKLSFRLASLFSAGSSLENVDLIAFEASLLLERAPTRLYLGSAFFTYVAGPLAEVLPPLLYRLLSPLAYNSFVHQFLSLEKSSIGHCTIEV